VRVFHEEKTYRNDFEQLLATSADDAWHPTHNKDYIEWWYFDSLNDDRSIIRGSFYVMGNLSKPNSVKTGARFFAVKPDGNEILIDEAFSLSSFSASRDKCELRVGENFVEGNPDHYRLHVESEDTILDLESASSLGGFRPSPEGKAYFNSKERFMAWVVLQPLAHVEGTLTAKGRTWNISGIGYHDHNWSNIPLIDYLTNWSWGRINDERFTIIFAEINTNERFNNLCMKTLTICNENTIIYATSESPKWSLGKSVFRVDPLTKVRYPEAYSLEADNEELSLDFSFSIEKLFGRMDLLEGQNSLAKWFIRTCRNVNPFSVAFLSRGDGGLLYQGKKDSLKGTVMHELVNFRR